MIRAIFKRSSCVLTAVCALALAAACADSRSPVEVSPDLESRALIVAAAPGWFWGFETDGLGWYRNAAIHVHRARSLTGGIPASEGDYFGWLVSRDQFARTKWGTPLDSPFPNAGYVTQVDLLLEERTGHPRIMASVHDPHGTPSGFFGILCDRLTDPTPHFVCGVTDEEQGFNGPAVDPTVRVTSTGWHTFRHAFYDRGDGVLAVDLSLVDPEGTLLETWTMTDVGLVIGSIVGGGNETYVQRRGGRLAAIDNTRRNDIAATKDDCKGGGWTSVVRQDGSFFENQGVCIRYVNTGT